MFGEVTFGRYTLAGGSTSKDLRIYSHLLLSISASCVWLRCDQSVSCSCCHRPKQLLPLCLPHYNRLNPQTISSTGPSSPRSLLVRCCSRQQKRWVPVAVACTQALFYVPGSSLEDPGRHLVLLPVRSTSHPWHPVPWDQLPSASHAGVNTQVQTCWPEHTGMKHIGVNTLAEPECSQWG